MLRKRMTFLMEKEAPSGASFFIGAHIRSYSRRMIRASSSDPGSGAGVKSEYPAPNGAEKLQSAGDGQEAAQVASGSLPAGLVRAARAAVDVLQHEASPQIDTRQLQDGRRDRGVLPPQVAFRGIAQHDDRQRAPFMNAEP